MTIQGISKAKRMSGKVSPSEQNEGFRTHKRFRSLYSTFQSSSKTKFRVISIPKISFSKDGWDKFKPMDKALLTLGWKGLERTFNNTSQLHRLNPECGEDAWFLKWLRKLDQVSHLSHNWDGCGTESPNSTAINHTRRVLLVLRRINFPPSQITPSVENGIGISFIRGTKYADVECFNTGEILAVTSTGQDTPTVWEVDSGTETIEATLRRIRDFIRG